MFACHVGIMKSACGDPGSSQRRNLNTQPDEHVTVSSEILRIRHAVALCVRPVWIRRIRPPVISFGEVVMLSAGAAGTRGISDRDWTFSQISLRGRQYAWPFEFRQIESGNGILS